MSMKAVLILSVLLLVITGELLNGPMTSRLPRYVAAPPQINQTEMLAAIEVTQAGLNSSLCPVSTALNLSASSKYYFYPADVYSPTKDELGSAIKCTAQDVLSFRKGYRDNCNGDLNCTHLCSTTKKYCPIRLHHVDDALQGLKGGHLCVFKEKLMNKSHTVNIYVSGGSVTSGSFTIGCCATSFCSGVGAYAQRCTWPYYLSEWFNRSFPATVSMHSFAEGGLNSNIGADLLSAKMKNLGIKHFTNNDIFFLDHSVNDNAVHITDEMITRGVESLIREIIQHSRPRSLPLIVLLDAAAKVLTGPLCRYCSTYEAVAAHYSIPLWSYRNAVLSNSNWDLKDSRYLQFINFQQARGMHPPWHVHLFMADLYASVIEKGFNACTDTDMHMQKAWHHRTLADFPIMSSDVVQLKCTETVLQLSHDAVVNNHQLVGSFSSTPENSWQLTQDIHGRMGGFIHQYGDTNAKSLNNATIVFHLNITARELVEKQINISLSMYYLRTYENAGMIEVTFCNKTIDNGTLDALWSESVSLPEKWSPASTLFPFSLCKEDQQHQQQQRVSVEVTHYPVKSRVGTQKFKILNVAACF